MTVEKSIYFERGLDAVLDFIAEDSLNRALEFLAELEEKLATLPYMPWKFRPSIYFDDEAIRDFVFKGYVIPYLVDTAKDKIVLLGIIKYRKSL
jgi:hypothetical protein